MHYLQLIKLQSGHKILYLLLKIFVSPGAQKMRLISQLIKIISRGLHKLLKYFNYTAILNSFVLQAARVFPVILILNLCNSEFTVIIWVISVISAQSSWCLQIRTFKLLLYLFEYCLFRLYSQWMVHNFLISLLYFFHVIVLYYHLFLLL